MTSTSVTHPSLLSGLRRGHEPSWERLVDLFGPMVFSMCCRSGMNSEAAADVMQETFLSISKSIEGFRYRDRSDTFRGWLRRIAQHRIADYHRRRSGVLSAIGGSDACLAMHNAAEQKADETQTEADGQLELRGVVHRAAALVQSEVEARSWAAFWMTTVENRSAPEAAEELGMQPAAVRKAKSRIARRLREVIGDFDEERE